MGRAERWTALSDGGSGLEDWLRSHFGRVEAVILDYYRASEYLADLAEARFRRWAHRLKHEGSSAILEELRSLSPPREPAREAWRKAVVDFENQVHRMDYPAYRAKGWQIGSGPVEAACKTVVGLRLKGVGMQWRPPGSSGVLQARALFLSGLDQWAAYWATRQKAG